MISPMAAIVRSPPSPSPVVQVLNNPAWNEDATQRQTVFLGVGSSPEELLCSRGSSGSSAIRSGTCVGDENCDERAIRAEEATGLPPVSVNSVMGQLISLQDNVVPGQYARCVMFCARGKQGNLHWKKLKERIKQVCVPAVCTQFCSCRSLLMQMAWLDFARSRWLVPVFIMHGSLERK